MTQDDIIESLPSHLRAFVAKQDYQQQYTPRDQAVWRFLLYRLRDRLATIAHPVYLEGLAKTGISLDHIPSIDEMNQCLAKLGWRAVVVDGFIPPAIFMEFQALRVLVIALEMRQIDHLLYTPAPDIVHESAGHAPFIADIDYAEYLQRFGELGMRAISNQHDEALYNAVRHLSIVKESEVSTPAQVADAEAHLAELSAKEVLPSEAALLTRLHWWTVEYGLVGEVDDYRLFGAGLLSSLGESTHCLDDAVVKKIPLTVEAIRTPYDITREQPQLFVTKNCRHLTQVLNEFAAGMAFSRGGTFGMQRAIDAQTVCTAVLNSGLQVSGIFCEQLLDAVGNPIFIKTSSPTQLAYRDRELYGQGTKHHAHGFSTPVGLIKDFSRCLSEYSIDELRALGVAVGADVTLAFLSGITVRGQLISITREEHRNLLFTFEQCLVTTLDGRVLFDPNWGVFDMGVGADIVSVFGGSADKSQFPLHVPPAPHAHVVREENAALMMAYEQVSQYTPDVPLQEWHALLDAHPNEWLLREEIRRQSRDVAGAGDELLLRCEHELRELLAEQPEILGVL
ncbi:MAG TPA: aromatic amino acid hydroxylase [Pseudomonadales bacterium]|nr:aromatic amino acid hydroxylase [Pseudomonadales bacterium]